jgi:uncharacterized membrane protein YphA (DoxX/SURF4 family)
MGALFIILTIIGALTLMAAVFLGLVVAVAHFWDALAWHVETDEELAYEPTPGRGLG